MRFRNLVFSCVVCLSLLAACGFVLVSAANGSDDNGRSYLEGREYQTFPEMSAASLSDGSFQKDFEQFAADSMPKRDGVMLYNALMQRRVIELANAPFRFDVYPTYFASGEAYAPDWDLLVEVPDDGAVLTGYFGTSSEAFGSLVESHPDLRWRFALVDRSSTAVLSPAHDSVVDSVDYDCVIEMMQESCPSSCEFVDLSADSLAEWRAWYFSTDHHWRVQGAYEAYCRVCASLGLEATEARYTRLYDGPFYGSNDRNGLFCDAYDYVDGLSVSLGGDATVKVNGQITEMGYLGYAYRDDGSVYAKQHKYENSYAYCFHGDPKLLEISNPDAAYDSSLLIIGDSYTNNCEALYAATYSHVYVLDPRYYDGSLSSFLAECEIDDVLVLCCDKTLKNTAFANFCAS